MIKGLAFVVAAFIFYVGFSIYRFNFEKTKLKTAEFKDKIDVILIEKSARKMSLLSGRKTVAQYDIDLGFNPIGHKEQEGDGRTPEGFYKISGRNPKSKYFLSLRISYPNDQDMQFATKKGVSSGGNIMIHGLPNKLSFLGFRKKLKKDWTQGCIAVQTNSEMKEIWNNVANGTMVEIRP